MNENEKRIANARKKIDELVDQGVMFNPAGVSDHTRARAAGNAQRTMMGQSTPGEFLRAKQNETKIVLKKPGAVSSPRAHGRWGERMPGRRYDKDSYFRD